MALKQCPKCGERFSDTYKECPFCEEDEVLQEGGRISRRKPRSVLTWVLVVLILLMAGLLTWLLFGDNYGQVQTRPAQAQEQVQPAQTPEETEKTEETGAAPEQQEEAAEPVPADQPEQTEGTKPEEKPALTPEELAALTYDQAAALPDGLTVSASDFTLKILGETNTLSVSGGSGTYRWISRDTEIVEVDSSGRITAISGGTGMVVVTDGTSKALITARVSAEGKLEGGSGTNDGGDAKLNREDITIAQGESFQLKLTGGGETPVWSTSDENIVTVSETGVVKGAGSGTATVTASWDGATRRCIVRVK